MKQFDNSSILSAWAKVFQHHCDYGMFLHYRNVTGLQRCIYHHGYEWQQHIYRLLQKKRRNRIERVWLCRRYACPYHRFIVRQVMHQYVTAFPAVAVHRVSIKQTWTCHQRTHGTRWWYQQEHEEEEMLLLCLIAIVLVTIGNFCHRSPQFERIVVYKSDMIRPSSDSYWRQNRRASVAQQHPMLIDRLGYTYLHWTSLNLVEALYDWQAVLFVCLFVA